MQAADLTPSPRYQALYEATVQEAAKRGGPVMARLVGAARQALQARTSESRDLRIRDALNEAAQLLLTHEADLCRRYPVALLAAFESPEAVKKAAAAPAAAVQFDQLELMDEAQVQATVVMAKAHQGALLVAEANLAELNTLLCSTLGLAVVKPERNPLRPDVYLAALREVLDGTRVSPAQRQEWFGAMSAPLGKELSQLYAALCERLRVEEVVPAGYAVLQSPGGPVGVRASSADASGTEESPASDSEEAGIASAHVGGSGAVRRTSPAQTHRSAARAQLGSDALLTLDKLRRLLSGELDQPQPTGRMAEFAKQFAQQFDSAHDQVDAPVSDFDVTVPAAFEALTEMKQASQVVARLEQRRDGAQGQPSGDQSTAGLRDFLRRSATGVAQALSLEVVTLMVDNIARDPQLLEPIRGVIRDLESPLLLLALVDPRFFTDKQHPARQLLQEITHRSMAFESETSSGFDEYLTQVKQGVSPLLQATIESAEPFEQVLKDLHTVWDRSAQHKDQARQAAVQALQHAEQRNMLAEKIATKIITHPDAVSVPRVVIEFLCGPWAQVVAQARILGGADSSAADKYQALISAMLWSAHPELTRKNISKLTRLVPLLLSTVREGVETIHYPATKTSAFLEALMGLHQLAFRASTKPRETADQAEIPSIPTPTPTPTTAPAQAIASLEKMLEDGNPWVAPAEAQASNFMEMPELRSDTAVSAPGIAAAPPLEAMGADALPLGTWVELLTNGKWVRTQLTWASPHGTLFLFTSAFGTAQSMTRRTRDRLAANGNLRIVSTQTVVDGALDAVAQIAMRNSIDVTL